MRTMLNLLFQKIAVNFDEFSDTARVKILSLQKFEETMIKENIIGRYFVFLVLKKR